MTSRIVDIKFIESEDGSTTCVATLGTGMYRIDDKLVHLPLHENKVYVKDPDNIYVATETIVVDHYENSTGDEQISTEDFEELQDHQKQMWFAVRRSTVTYDGPMAVTRRNVSLKTDNEYIVSCYTVVTETDPTLYLYKRNEALVGCAKEMFTELGMTRSENTSYYTSDTKEQKIWRFYGYGSYKVESIAAFGSQIFQNHFLNVADRRGTLESCTELYEKDRKLVREIIKSHYNMVFKHADLNSLQMSLVLSKLSGIKSAISRVDPKIKTSGDYNRSLENIRDLEETIRKYAANFDEE